MGDSVQATNRRIRVENSVKSRFRRLREPANAAFWLNTARYRDGEEEESLDNRNQKGDSAIEVANRT